MKKITNNDVIVYKLDQIQFTFYERHFFLVILICNQVVVTNNHFEKQ